MREKDEGEEKQKEEGRGRREVEELGKSRGGELVLGTGQGLAKMATYTPSPPPILVWLLPRAGWKAAPASEPSKSTAPGKTAQPGGGRRCRCCLNGRSVILSPEPPQQLAPLDSRAQRSIAYHTNGSHKAN